MGCICISFCGCMTITNMFDSRKEKLKKIKNETNNK